MVREAYKEVVRSAKYNSYEKRKSEKALERFREKPYALQRKERLVEKHG